MENSIDVLGSVLGSDLNNIQLGLERKGFKRLSKRVTKANDLLQSVYEEMVKKQINFEF